MKLRDEHVAAAGGCAPCQFAAVAKESSNAGDPNATPGPSVLVLDPSKSGYIGIELVDTKKRPVGAALFELLMPDGSKISGSLDAPGKVGWRTPELSVIPDIVLAGSRRGGGRARRGARH